MLSKINVIKVRSFKRNALDDILFLGNGSIFGLTEDEDKFRRWQIYQPEVARAVSQFEDSTVLTENEHSEFHHHEDSQSFQKKI